MDESVGGPVVFVGTRDCSTQNAFLAKAILENARSVVLEMSLFLNSQKLSPLEHTARGFALCAHQGQRYGKDPYIMHLDMVHDVGVEFGATHNILVASFLHDVLEDTNVPAVALEETFGRAIALLVQAVTTLPGRYRKERIKETYPLIRQSGYEAVFLKLCDRIANVRACINTENKSLLSMYETEHPYFRSCLCRPGELATVWRTLDRLFVSGDESA